jgi:hypothetical protein
VDAVRGRSPWCRRPSPTSTSSEIRSGSIAKADVDEYGELPEPAGTSGMICQ